MYVCWCLLSHYTLPNFLTIPSGLFDQFNTSKGKGHSSLCVSLNQYKIIELIILIL